MLAVSLRLIAIFIFIIYLAAKLGCINILFGGISDRSGNRSSFLRNDLFFQE